MKNNTQPVDQLRRLRVLQALERVAPDPIGQGLILQVVQTDAELTPTIKRVQRSLNYLADNGLVDLITVEGTDWMAATITNVGQAFLASNDANPELDIYHPSNKPEPIPSNYRGRVSSITSLPPDVKAWLDQELIRRNFTGYIELSELLAERGYSIKKSSVGRYGKKFKDAQKKLKQTVEISKALAEVIGDDGGAMAQTLTALMQQEAIAIIQEGRYASNGIDFTKLMSAVSQLNRTDLSVKKYAAGVKAKAAEAAKKADKLVQSSGMTAAERRELKKLITEVAS